VTSPQRFWQSLPVIPQGMIDLLLSQGVDPLAIGSAANPPLKVSIGQCAADGWFLPNETENLCITIPVDDGAGLIDVAFWDQRTGKTARLLKCGFALGEEQINNPGIYSFGGHLKIHVSPLGWLRSGRNGIFVLDWSHAFDRLRHCPRIAMDACLLTKYRAAMQPPQLPELFVLTDDKEAA